MVKNNSFENWLEKHNLEVKTEFKQDNTGWIASIDLSPGAGNIDCPTRIQFFVDQAVVSLKYCLYGQIWIKDAQFKCAQTIIGDFDL